MIDVLQQFGGGILACFQPVNFLALAVGLVMGMLVAVLPGLTAVMGIVLALPFTFSMPITPAIILLSAMYISGTYGGAFTSILFRIPGEPLDVPLLWDGFQMARKGEPAKALGWTMFAALVGGVISVILAVLMAPQFASFGLKFDSPEYFAILLFALTTVVALGGTSMVNALISLFLGLIVATVGVDVVYGADRFTFGVPMLSDGVEYLTVMVGAYGLGEVLTRLEKRFKAAQFTEKSGTIATRFPSLPEVWQMRATFARSSAIGLALGTIPGAGATIASFVSYGTEAQYCKRRKLLGSGIAEGIAAPQTASTATVAAAMVPLLTLGIPGSGATAVILGAFLLQGIQPGPQVFIKDSTLVFTIFGSLLLGIIGMCLLGYFAIKALIRVLYLPEAITSAFVIIFCFIGAFSARNNITDLWMIVVFGIVGYLFERFKFPIAPMVLGCILGPQTENAFMISMISYQGDWTVYFTRPIAGTIMALSLLALAYPLMRHVSHQRRSARLGEKSAY
jgi:putative tricarboxylic transport membrane protein